MALDASALSAAIEAGMLADPAIGATEGDALTAMCDAIASAVVAHIVSSAVVTVNSLSGVTACPAGAGTCAGTGAGTIT